MDHGHDVKYFSKHNLIKLKTGFIDYNENVDGTKRVKQISTSFTDLHVYYTDGTDRVFKIKSPADIRAIRFDNYEKYKIGILLKCGNYLDLESYSGVWCHIFKDNCYDNEWDHIKTVYAGYTCPYDLYLCIPDKLQSIPGITIINEKFATSISLTKLPAPKYYKGVPYLYKDRDGILYNYARIHNYGYYNNNHLINQYGVFTTLITLDKIAIEIDHNRCHNGFKVYNWPHQIKTAYLLNEHYFTYIEGCLCFLDMRLKNTGGHTKAALRTTIED
jgi:hypothetical protein